MGVQGLWTVAQPCARPTQLATLNRKRLAVDASIWIYQFLKAVRDKEGNALRNSHVVGFFRRICKLLWFGIQPVFVFDGGAPALKRATLQNRRRRREGCREDAVRTVGKLLAVQMQRLAEDEAEHRKRSAADTVPGTVGAREEEDQEELPDPENMVYVEELGTSKQERQQNRAFRKEDPYHLPELANGIEGMAKPNDPRIMSIEELEAYAKQFNEGEDISLYDLSKIDFDSEFFKSLPAVDRYNILNAARIKSRLRMGYSKEQLDDMFPDRMAFSRFQIERATRRNHLTQRLMHELGMTGLDLTIGGSARVASEKDREYILVKNEGAEGGWALGVVNKENGKGASHNPIDVDEPEFQFQDPDEEDEWEDDLDFEDVPIEGLNRLPKLKKSQHAYRQARNMSSTRRQIYSSREQNPIDDEESLFVDDYDNGDVVEGDDLDQDEEDDLNKAIAMSLENQFRAATPNREPEERAEISLPPNWNQQAAEVSQPIAYTRGSTLAQIVNNRANASVQKRRESNESSDSDLDFQSSLAAARKKLKEKAPVAPSSKRPLEGPLPFEALDWRVSIASREPPKQQTAGTSSDMPEVESDSKLQGKLQDVETGDLEAESDEEAGGFERDAAAEESEESVAEESAPQDYEAGVPRPLPPWLADDVDIRDSVKKQQEQDKKMAAEDEEMVRQEQMQFQQLQRKEVIEIQSSDDESALEIIDAPMETRDADSVSQGAEHEMPTSSPQGTLEVSHAEAVPNHEPETSGSPGLVSPSVPVVNPEIQARSSESPSSPSELEFEDVMIDDALETDLSGTAATGQGVTMNDTLSNPDFAEAARQLAAGPKFDVEESQPIDPDAPALEEFDDFSDPEDEELLAQLAEEAEAHAQFASQLNNKSERENQEAYEKELRALRTQQKKDRRDADEVTQIMVTECQSLLRLFGLPYITAPMEAEAQCAELVQLGLVDGIVTDDSDVFLFGGTRVYKNMFNGNKLVECYLSSDLEKELSLSREHLIALAQLLGSDYAEGIPGVGPVTAVEILSEFPGSDSLGEFKKWWSDVQQGNRPMDADVNSSFRRKFRKSHAAKLFLPPGFPSPAVVDAYLHPDVDRNPEPFQWGVPDLEGLRKFLMATIGWGQERTDEVLVPVIRDMNKREQEGTQSNITRYFSGSVGAGAKEAFAPRQRGQASKRMASAVNRLRAKQGGSTDTAATEPPTAKKVSRKRKAKEPIVIEDDDEENNENGNSPTGGHDRDHEHEHDADVSNEGKRKSRTRSVQKGKEKSAGKAKGKGVGKRNKASSD